jgi:hypothetical protein
MTEAKREEVVVSGRPLRGGDDEPETQSYKLREGFTGHMHNGRVLNADEEVELTEAQARAFFDKFEPVKEPRALKTGKLDRGIEEAPTFDSSKPTAPPPTPRPVTHTPQDLGAKTHDPSMPPMNPGNAVAAGHGVVNPAALQSAAAPGKKELGLAADGEVKSGQTPPIRNEAAAAVAGGTQQPPAAPEKK